MFPIHKGKNMKKRSVIKLENFLLISTKMLGISAWSIVASWFVIPVRTVRDARDVAKKSNRKFNQCVDEAYNDNVLRFAQIPFSVYESAKLQANKRLKDFDEEELKKTIMWHIKTSKIM